MIKNIYYSLKFLFSPQGTYVHKINMTSLQAMTLRGFKVYVADDSGGYWMPIGILGSRYMRVSRNSRLNIDVRYGG